MNLSLDVNKLFDSAVSALLHGLGVWVVFGLVALVMSPWIIPAVSNAIAQHRQLSHKREQSLLKIRNSVADRSKRQRVEGPKR